MRFGADTDGGKAFTDPDAPRIERWPVSSVLKRLKIASIALSLSAFAASAALLACGVFALDVPRLRAFPKGPFSSGMRRWFLSELLAFMSANARVLR
jgi:hypothetical protein